MSEDVKISQKQRGMKWYNFIVKIQLWLAMLSFVYLGCLFLQGQMYGDAATAVIVYFAFPVMKTVDVGFGLFSFICAVFAYRVRKQLLNFEKDAPKNYLLVTSYLFLSPLIHNLAVCIYTEMLFLDIMGSELLTLLIACIEHLIINIIYFHKRKYMFGAAGIRYKE